MHIPIPFIWKPMVSYLRYLSHRSVLSSCLDDPSSIPNFLVEVFCSTFSLAHFRPGLCPATLSLSCITSTTWSSDLQTSTHLCFSWESQIICQVHWMKCSAKVSFLSLVLRRCGKLAENRVSVSFFPSVICHMIFKSPRKRTNNEFYIFTPKDRNPCPD